jgi:hypothetical protein
MACDDSDRREFREVPVGATYELSVDGPAGFGAFAHFAEGETSDLEQWPFEDISPGPKKKKLPASDRAHSVVVIVNIDGTADIKIEVKAELDGKKYCRTLTGKGTTHVIIHRIRMAK